MNWKALAKAAFEEHDRRIAEKLPFGPGKRLKFEELEPASRPAWEETVITVCDLYRWGWCP
jgi:hypothetical protein